MRRIATIARDAAHSPNMAANDAAIMECVASELRAMGAEVIECKGNVLPAGIDTVCHMSRSQETIGMLAEAERNGIIAVNSTDAVRNCSRRQMMETMRRGEIPQPPFIIIDGKEALEGLGYPAWIKRAEGWSNHKDDVCYVSDAKEAQAAFEQMQKRGIRSCIHCKHTEGDIIKFYGVGEEFFRYCYPDPGKSKFGLEEFNGIQHHYPFEVERLKSTVLAAAKAIGLEIYGGDCIVNSNGEIFIIDMNDFPSFTAVRHEAARSIAGYIMNRKTEKR